MGCGSSTVGKDSKSVSSRHASRINMQKYEEESGKIKILLLGAGDSGKSTIAKQIKHIKFGFSEQEKKMYGDYVHNNLIIAFQDLVKYAEQEKLEIKDQKSVDIVKDFKQFVRLKEDEIDAINSLWKEESIQKIYKNISDYQINDTTEYYMSRIDDIKEDEYVPNDEDIMRCRMKTTGITEVDFVHEDKEVRLVDVGGQRSERSKWAKCFSNVKIVFFCVGSNGYDLKLYEDNKTNRIKEALKVFGDISSSVLFEEAHVVLLFNKNDLFKEKIKNVDLNVCFDDYEGGCDYDKAMEHMQNTFKQVADDTKKSTLELHTLIATDTDDVREKFDKIIKTYIQNH